MARNVEAITICIDHEMAEIAKANAKCEGRVKLNDLMEWAGNGCPKDRVDLDGPDNWAGDKCPEMRSTKVPNRSGHGFSVETVNKDVSSRDDFFVAMARRSGVPAQMMTSRTRRRERPSGHAQLEQQLGGEDHAGVVCWQKPPGCTGIPWRHCWFFTGQCNKRRRCSVGQEADRRVAVPPSLKGFVRLLYERSPKKCKEAGGAQNDGMAFPSRPSKTSQARTIFSLHADTRSGAPARTTSLTTRWQERPSGHAQLEQQLGEEDCAGVVCWQKPPGHTRIHQRCCRIFKGWCNKRWRRSIGQKANRQVAAPPSPNGLVGLSCERVLKV
jgi:hypothetical protein